jgi:hypothetical protein
MYLFSPELDCCESFTMTVSHLDKNEPLVRPIAVRIIRAPSHEGPKLVRALAPAGRVARTQSSPNLADAACSAGDYSSSMAQVPSLLTNETLAGVLEVSFSPTF